MKKGLLLAIVIISLLVMGCSQSMKKGTFTTTEGNIVTISGYAFDPPAIKVNAGSTITWINEDSAPHTIKFDAFESEKLNSGGKYEHVFAEAGEFTYICGLHPSMKGKVIVQ